MLNLLDNNLRRRMQIWLFATFLVIFVATSVLTLLALFGDLGSLTDDQKNLLAGATVVEVAAGIVALFFAMFGLRPKLAAQRELDSFCQSVEGHWWSSRADPGSVGVVTLTPVGMAGTLSEWPFLWSKWRGGGGVGKRR